MKILFSPVGNSDPWRNDRDGAMLHITRIYQPDILLLFFTESIWKDRLNEKGEILNGHQHYNWKEIIQTVSPQTKVIKEVRAVNNENSYDSYKEIFHQYLVALEKEFPNAQFLLNVTSGTPQMGATLCLEYITFPENKTCVQVSTPSETSNINVKHATPEFQTIDIEIVNEEEQESASRCSEIQILSFRETIIRTQLISLIEHYDYSSAHLLASSNKNIRNSEKIRRILLEISRNIQMHHIFPEIEKAYRNSALKKVLFHYLILNMRYRRRDYAEVLIRLKAIAEFTLEYKLSKKYPGLLYYRQTHGHKTKPYINIKYSDEFKEQYERFLTNKGWQFNTQQPAGFVEYLSIIEVTEPESESLEILKTIGEVNHLRNSIAHRLDRLDLDRNEHLNKIISAVKALKRLILLTFPEIKEESFSFFDKKNEEIKALL